MYLERVPLVRLQLRVRLARVRHQYTQPQQGQQPIITTLEFSTRPTRPQAQAPAHAGRGRLCLRGGRGIGLGLRRVGAVGEEDGLCVGGVVID